MNEFIRLKWSLIVMVLGGLIFTVNSFAQNSATKVEMQTTMEVITVEQATRLAQEVKKSVGGTEKNRPRISLPANPPVEKQGANIEEHTTPKEELEKTPPENINKERSAAKKVAAQRSSNKTIVTPVITPPSAPTSETRKPSVGIADSLLNDGEKVMNTYKNQSPSNLEQKENRGDTPSTATRAHVGLEGLRKKSATSTKQAVGEEEQQNRSGAEDVRGTKQPPRAKGHSSSSTTGRRR